MAGVTDKGLSFLKEFRDFAMRGNVLDMAIGVVIGTAFGKIVSSLVSDVIMPCVGVLVGNVDFKHLAIKLLDKTEDHDAIVLTYGNFLQTVFDFVIIAFAIFMAMKFLNRLKQSLINEDKDEEKKSEAQAPDVQLLTEIRDILKAQNQK